MACSHGAEPCHRDSGFTLVELMIVIGVAAMVMSILVVGIRQASASFALRKAASTTMSEIRRAQAGAIAEGIDYTIEFVLGTPGSLIASRPKAIGETCPSGMTEDVSLSLCKRQTTGDSNWPRSVAIKSSTLPANKVTFGRLGAPSSGGEIVLQSESGTQWNITIEPATGKVSVPR